MATATESGHWYTTDGEPAYTQIAKSGRERPTTLRDARKLNLAPSVTTILNVAAKPGLERWKINQALLAALTLPREDGESLDDFMARADRDAREQAYRAAEEGERIHAAVERFFLDQTYPPLYEEQVNAVRQALWDEFGFQPWRAEKSFFSAAGYGGKVDLHSPNVVIDFKTKDGDLENISAYEEQAMQLDAYRHGLGYPDARIANVFISRTHPGAVKVIEHKPGPSYYEMFLCLLKYWQLKTGHSPSG